MPLPRAEWLRRCRCRCEADDRSAAQRHLRMFMASPVLPGGADGLRCAQPEAELALERSELADASQSVSRLGQVYNVAETPRLSLTDVTQENLTIGGTAATCPCFSR